MSRFLQDIIKSFDFNNETRSKVDLTGGLRLQIGRPQGRADRLTIPAAATDAGLYSVDQTLFAATWATNPRGAKEWRGFEALVAHALDDLGEPLTFDRYRLGDGTTTYWWDGGAWTPITPLDTEWNTEAEIANNIASFPITTQTIQVVVNLYTTDKTVSPSLYGIKVLYGSDTDHREDYITRSLVPDLKLGIRPIARVQIEQQETGTEFCLDLSEIETPYNIVGVDSVYDDDADPDHIVDLVSSFDSDSGVVTLTTSVDAGATMHVRFLYQPVVAVRTSRDYIEVDKLPSLQITDIEYINQRELKDDSVLNKSTHTGVTVKSGRQRDIEATVRFMTDKLVDYQRLAHKITTYFTKNTLLRSRGLDEEFSILIVDDPGMTGGPNSLDVTSGQLRIRIVNAVFFERGSVVAYGVDRLTLGGSFRSGFNNPNVTVP
jgi:hypothetical protein